MSKTLRELLRDLPYEDGPREIRYTRHGRIYAAHPAWSGEFEMQVQSRYKCGEAAFFMSHYDGRYQRTAPTHTARKLSAVLLDPATVIDFAPRRIINAIARERHNA